MSAWLIVAVGVAYAVVAAEQITKGNIYMAIVYAGYSFSNVGLYMMTR